eukprot:jgi/Astpho2/357/e_gw1.00010.102.1_t
MIQDSGRSAVGRKPVAATQGTEQTEAGPHEITREPERKSLAGSKRRRKADSTDFIASGLTRRFGLLGGLAWVGVLTFGVVSEQVKTRLEQAQEEKGGKEVTDGKEVTLPSGVRFTDEKIGGGAPTQLGYLVILDYKAYANGELFQDTKKRGKPIVFILGARPLTGGLCPGVEEALKSMRAGGKRTVVVPPSEGFGDNGVTLKPTEHVPDKQGEVAPGATLTYELELVRVSIPPS